MSFQEISESVSKLTIIIIIIWLSAQLAEVAWQPVIWTRCETLELQILSIFPAEPILLHSCSVNGELSYFVSPVLNLHIAKPLIY